MLIKILRVFLRPYRRPLALVVVLQLADARHAVPAHAERRHHRQRRDQRRHAATSCGPAASCSRSRWCRSCARSARCTSAPGPRWRSAATCGAAVFDRVQTFSAREVGQFGAPSLITRTTNDVQQVQMLALMTFTLMVSAPIMCVGGIILALEPGRAAVRRCCWSRCRCSASCVTLIICRMRPLFRHDAGADRQHQPGAARADHRHPGDPRVRPRRRTSGSGSATPTPSCSTCRWAPAG